MIGAGRSVAHLVPKFLLWPVDRAKQAVAVLEAEHALHLVTSPDQKDAVQAEVLRRTATLSRLDALRSVYADIAYGKTFPTPEETE